MHPESARFPDYGIGGIETREDATEFLLGAATLQVTTGIGAIAVAL